MPKPNTKRSFIYLAGHIVGNPEDWGMCYDTDMKEYSTRQAAQRHGEMTLEHDDFLVGEIQNKKIVALYFGDEKRTDKKEIAEVNEELALS